MLLELAMRIGLLNSLDETAVWQFSFSLQRQLRGYGEGQRCTWERKQVLHPKWLRKQVISMGGLPCLSLHYMLSVISTLPSLQNTKHEKMIRTVYLTTHFLDKHLNTFCFVCLFCYCCCFSPQSLWEEPDCEGVNVVYWARARRTGVENGNCSHI